MPVKTYKKAKGKADKLFSEIIRLNRECEAEGWDSIPCSKQIQTMHIVTRKRSATRTDLRNAMAGCFAHHRYFTDYPRQFSRFISTTWAQGYYDQIYTKSITPTKVDWEERVDFLTDIKQRLVEGEITIAKARQYET